MTATAQTAVANSEDDATESTSQDGLDASAARLPYEAPLTALRSVADRLCVMPTMTALADCLKTMSQTTPGADPDSEMSTTTTTPESPKWPPTRWRIEPATLPNNDRYRS